MTEIVRVKWTQGRQYEGPSLMDVLTQMRMNQWFTDHSTNQEYKEGVQRRARVFGVTVRVDTVENFFHDLEEVGLVKIERLSVL